MASSLVSILVPIYNVEPYIERCTRSLFEQTYDNLEFVFVDDCTPDKSIQILETVIKDYPARAKRTRIIQHNRNRGIAATRNTLIENARGEFLVWMDSDDWMEQNAVELLVKRQQETDADIVTGQVLAHYDNREELYLPNDWHLGKEDLLVNIMNQESSTSLLRRLIRRNLYTQHGIKNMEGANCSEDFQVFPRLLYYANSVAGIDVIIYHYNCANGSSYTHAFTKDLSMQLQILTNRRFISDFFMDKNNYIKELCDKKTTQIAHYLMRLNLWNRNKNGYNIFVRELMDHFRPYWGQIGWDNKNVRLVESHYWFMYLSFIVKKVINKIKRIASYAR